MGHSQSTPFVGESISTPSPFLPLPFLHSSFYFFFGSGNHIEEKRSEKEIGIGGYYTPFLTSSSLPPPPLGVPTLNTPFPPPLCLFPHPGDTTNRYHQFTTTESRPHLIVLSAKLSLFLDSRLHLSGYFFHLPLFPSKQTNKTNASGETKKQT